MCLAIVTVCLNRESTTTYGLFIPHGNRTGNRRRERDWEQWVLNMLYRNVHTGPRQGKKLGSIVSYCTGPVPCAHPIRFACSVNKLLLPRFGRFSNCYELPRMVFYSSLRPRLNVVKIPVRREDACKPTLLPDGRTVYRCTYCSKDFGSFSDINRHMDFHEGRGKFHFPLCF